MSEEEKKKLYIYVLLASVVSGGGSLGVNKFTSTVRDNPFTGTQGQALSDRIGENTKQANMATRNVERINDQSESNSVRITELERTMISRTYFKDKCADMNARVEHIEADDKKAEDDISRLFMLIGKLPPQELTSRVSTLEVRQHHIDKNVTWILEQFRSGK